MNKKKWIALIVACLMVVAVLAGCNGTKEKYAAKVNGMAVTRPIFVTLFNVELSMLYAEDETCLPFEQLGTDAFYKALKETKNKEGKTYFDQLAESTLDSCQKFVINLQMAQKDKSWPSKKDLQKDKDNMRAELEQAVSYYGAEDADQLCIMTEGIPLEDYLEYYALSGALDEFNNDKMEKFKIDEADLREFYDAHEDLYKDLSVRTVRVRHSLFLTEELNDTEKATLKTKVDGYITAYNNGTMTMDEIVALSEDPGVKENDGYYDVTENASFVEEFLDWAVSRETVSDEIEVIETDYGYHVMQCVKIWTPDFEDASVKDVVKVDFKADLLDKELTDLATEKKNAIKNRNNKVIDSFIKQAVTGAFEGSKALEQPTPKPKDEAASETYVATLGADKLWSADYGYFFSKAVSEIISEDFTIDNTLSEKEQYDQLVAFLNGSYKDSGKTYLEYCKERALELQMQFIITYNKAIEAGNALTDERIEELNSEIDSLIDQYLSYYGSSFGVSTRDEMMDYMMGMNVNEYKRFNLLQTIVSEFADAKMKEMKPSGDVLKAYYNANKDSYRTVTVRHIFLSLVDKDGNAVSTDKKAEITAIANQLIQKIKDGDSADLLVEVWSEDENAQYDLGLVDLLKGSTTLDADIVTWAMNQAKIGKDTVKLFETKSGYEIVLVEGILEYDAQQGIAASEDLTADSMKSTVESSYKNEQFQKLVDEYVAASTLSVENINQELIDMAVESYLTYEASEEEGEDSSKS